MSQADHERRSRRVRWTLPVLLGFVVAALLQWTIQDWGSLSGTVSAIRDHAARAGHSVGQLRGQLAGVRERSAWLGEHIAGLAGRLDPVLDWKGARSEHEPVGAPAAVPAPASPVGSAAPSPVAAADPGMSYEDPLAPLAFLTKRMEESRAAAEAERSRSEAARRKAVALARRLESETAESGPASTTAPEPVHGNGHPGRGFEVEGANDTASLPLHIGAMVDGPNGHDGEAPSARATHSTVGGVPYPAGMVPRPAASHANGLVPRPASTSSKGEVRTAAVGDAEGQGQSRSPVTIGEPIRDTPQSPRLMASAGSVVTGGTVPRPPGPRVAQASGPVPPPPPSALSDGDDDEAPPLIGPERAPALESERLFRAGGVLLPPGRLRIEPSLTYAVSDRFRIVTRGLDVVDVIFIGNFDSQDTRRESLTSSVTFRYGVSPRFNIRGTIPYEWRTATSIPSALVDSVLQNARGQQTERISGMGDLSLGFSYQLYRSDSRLPNVVGNFTYSLDTGDEGVGRGADQFSGGLTFMTQSDPAVLFGSVSYLRMLDDVDGFRRGDMIGGSLGFSYALNYDLSLSTSVSFLRQIEDIEFNQVVDESLIARRTFISTLSFGVTYALSNRTVVDMSVGIGLTDDAPEFGFTLSFPMVFNTSDWW